MAHKIVDLPLILVVIFQFFNLYQRDAPLEDVFSFNTIWL